MTRNEGLSFANLVAIVVSIAAVMAPHIPHVPNWTIAFCTIGLLVRLTGA